MFVLNFGMRSGGGIGERGRRAAAAVLSVVVVPLTISIVRGGAGDRLDGGEGQGKGAYRMVRLRAAAAAVVEAADHCLQLYRRARRSMIWRSMSC